MGVIRIPFSRKALDQKGGLNLPWSFLTPQQNKFHYQATCGTVLVRETISHPADIRAVSFAAAAVDKRIQYWCHDFGYLAIGHNKLLY
jgi:hypothetical protein